MTIIEDKEIVKRRRGRPKRPEDFMEREFLGRKTW